MDHAEEILSHVFLADPEGKPLKGVEIKVWEASGLPRVKTCTDAGGVIRFPAADQGSRYLVVREEKKLVAWRGVIPDGGSHHFVLSPQPNTGALEGYVREAVTGESIRAMLRIMSQDDLVLEERPTGPDGRFTLGGLPEGHYKIVASKEGYGVGWTGAAVIPAATTRVEIRLGRATGGVTGKIVNKERKSPLLSAYTVYTGQGLPLFTRFVGRNGKFGFAGLAEGKYLLQLAASGFLPVVEDFWVSSKEITAIEIPLFPGRSGFSLAGRIVNGRRNPISGAVVRVFDRQERPLGLALTDEEGRFLFPSLPSGELSMVVSGPGIAARVFTVSLPIGGWWEGEVADDPCRFLKRFTDEDGRPLADAEIRIEEKVSGRRLFTVLTNREGFFFIRAWSFSSPTPSWRWSVERSC